MVQCAVETLQFSVSELIQGIKTALRTCVKPPNFTPLSLPKPPAENKNTSSSAHPPNRSEGVILQQLLNPSNLFFHPSVNPTYPIFIFSPTSISPLLFPGHLSRPLPPRPVQKQSCLPIPLHPPPARWRHPRLSCSVPPGPAVLGAAPAARGPRGSAAAPGSGRAPRKHPASGGRRRPSADTGPAPAGSARPPRPAPPAPPAAGPRGCPEGAAGPRGGRCGPRSVPAGADGEVPTYLSLLSTPSWIHLSTSHKALWERPALPAARKAEGGGVRGRDGHGGGSGHWDGDRNGLRVGLRTGTERRWGQAGSRCG